jgi:hypothetical protein
LLKNLVGHLLGRADVPIRAVSEPTFATKEVEKRQNCGNQTNSGNGSTQVCGNNNNNDGGSGSSGQVPNVSHSQRLSQSDKIAIGLGVGGGVIAIVGAILAYLQYRRMRQRPKEEPDSVALENWEYSSSPQQQQPHYGYRPPGRAELGS